MEKIYSMPAIENSESEILILGTIPGGESLKYQQYYQNKDNLFWDIMFRICDPNWPFFEEVYAIPYEKRKQLLLDNKISLWDILESCERDGNSDRTIKNERLNDLETYLKLHPKIRKICFNGQKAYSYYKKMVYNLPQKIHPIELYSTRPSIPDISFSILNQLGESRFSFHEHGVDDSLSLTANLKQAFRETDWLKNPFRRINVLMAGKRFTFIPLEFFEDEQAETVFYHNHSRQDNELVQYNILHKNNIVVLFGMDKSACSLLREQYPDVRFYAQASPLIEYFAAKSRLGNCRKMYVHLRKEAAEIYAYERGRLAFANTFACKETNDRLYYILCVWKQLGMAQERDELHLTGELYDKEQLLSELKKFIRQVFIMNPAANLDLQAINLCE